MNNSTRNSSAPGGFSQGPASGDGFNNASSTRAKMHEARRWLIWKYGPKPKGKKPRKLPYYVGGNSREKPLDCESDWSQLASYEKAVAWCEAHPEFRLGFALGPDGSGNYWQGLDFDNTLDGCKELPGYVELSPSEAGYHGIGYGPHFHAYTDKFEAYSSGRFFTFTGNQINDGPLHDFAEFVNRHHASLKEHVASVQQEVKNYTVDQLLDAMSVIPNDDLPWEPWNNVGMALWAAVGEMERSRAYVAWAAFSAKSAKFDPRETLDKWEHIGRSPPTQIGAGTIIHLARKAGWKGVKASEGADGPLVEDALRYVPGAQPLAPMEFVLENFVRTGLYAFYGPYNAGKTSTIVALSLFVAGLLQMPGLPESLRRKVYYIAEDPEQIVNLIEGYYAKGMLSGDFGEWFFIIPSKRKPSEYWSKKIQSVIEDNGRTWGAPLVIFDTASSNMDIEDISNNSKVGEFIAALKEGSRSGPLMLSVWIVMHVSKALREETAEGLTALGAQAWGADTFGEMKFTIEEDKYCVTLGKRRFEIEPNERGLAVDRYVVSSEVLSVALAEAPWKDAHPALVRKARTLRVVREFESSSLEGAKEERANDARAARKVAVAKEVWSRLVGMLRDAKEFGAPGICVWAVEGKKQSPPKESLREHRWYGHANFSARSDPKKDERELILAYLLSSSDSKRVGDVLFFPVSILEGNFAKYEY